MKNEIKPLAKSFLIPLGLTAAASAADAGKHKKILGSGYHPLDSAPHNNAILIMSNDETEEIIKIVKSHNEAKKQKERFFNMLLGTLGASLLGNI